MLRRSFRPITKRASHKPAPQRGAHSFLAPAPLKVAEEALVSRGLQLSDELISYANIDSSGGTRGGGKVASNVYSNDGAIDPRKLAAAASVLGRQSALIGELKSAHMESVRMTAALAGAVKLAQDGAIDVEDVFKVARETIASGTAKLSSVEALYDQSPGTLVGGDDGAARQPENTESASDVLTAALRGLRRTP